MDVPPKNSLESHPLNLTALFKKDLVALKGFFSEEVLSLVENNIDFLMKDYVAWQRALVAMTKNLGVKYDSIASIPGIIEKVSFENVEKKFSTENPKKIILGIAGPGAVGKETIKKDLGFNMVINTSTRQKRDYESHGEHYHFVSDAEFKKIASENGFVVSMKREGRGQYGIQKKDIAKVLLESKVVMIEENPVNLTGLSVHIILFNKKSEIMICKRSSNKKTYPNKITSSAGGHVEQGESYKAAAIRELKEELGIKAFLKDLGRFNVITSKERTIHHLFMGKVNKKVSADPNEIASYYFSPLKTIKSDIALHPRKYAKPFHEAFKCYLKYI